MSRHDFGATLKLTRCSRCRRVTRNRGCPGTREVFCKGCYDLHIPCCDVCVSRPRLPTSCTATPVTSFADDDRAPARLLATNLLSLVLREEEEGTQDAPSSELDAKLPPESQTRTAGSASAKASWQRVASSVQAHKNGTDAVGNAARPAHLPPLQTGAEEEEEEGKAGARRSRCCSRCGLLCARLLAAVFLVAAVAGLCASSLLTYELHDSVSQVLSEENLRHFDFSLRPAGTLGGERSRCLAAVGAAKNTSTKVADDEAPELRDGARLAVRVCDEVAREMRQFLVYPDGTLRPRATPELCAGVSGQYGARTPALQRCEAGDENAGQRNTSVLRISSGSLAGSKRLSASTETPALCAAAANATRAGPAFDDDSLYLKRCDEEVGIDDLFVYGGAPYLVPHLADKIFDVTAALAPANGTFGVSRHLPAVLADIRDEAADVVAFIRERAQDFKGALVNEYPWLPAYMEDLWNQTVEAALSNANVARSKAEPWMAVSTAALADFAPAQWETLQNAHDDFVRPLLDNVSASCLPEGVTLNSTWRDVRGLLSADVVALLRQPTVPLLLAVAVIFAVEFLSCSSSCHARTCCCGKRPGFCVTLLIIAATVFVATTTITIQVALDSGATHAQAGSAEALDFTIRPAGATDRCLFAEELSANATVGMHACSFGLAEQFLFLGDGSIRARAAQNLCLTFIQDGRRKGLRLDDCANSTQQTWTTREMAINSLLLETHQGLCVGFRLGGKSGDKLTLKTCSADKNHYFTHGGTDRGVDVLAYRIDQIIRATTLPSFVDGLSDAMVFLSEIRILPFVTILLALSAYFC